MASDRTRRRDIDRLRVAACLMTRFVFHPLTEFDFGQHTLIKCTTASLAEHGGGLFHICLEVEGIDATLAAMKGKGVSLLNETPMIGHGGCRIAFLDPKSMGNVMIELAEMPKGAVHGHGAGHAG